MEGVRKNKMKTEQEIVLQKKMIIIFSLVILTVTMGILNIKKENLDMWLTIKKRDAWEFEITFDAIRLEKPELKLPNEYKMECIFTLEDDSTIVCFKEVIK